MNSEEARNILESLSSDLWRELHPSQRDALDMAIEALKESRPHGEWIKKYDADDPTTVCSVCCFDTEDQVYFHFCPNCGADMRKEGERNE